MPATDADLYEGALHREAERGVKTNTFKVPGDRPDEICVIPKHLPFANYRGKDGAKDIADEQQFPWKNEHAGKCCAVSELELAKRKQETWAFMERTVLSNS